MRLCLQDWPLTEQSIDTIITIYIRNMLIEYLIFFFISFYFKDKERHLIMYFVFVTARRKAAEGKRKRKTEEEEIASKFLSTHSHTHTHIFSISIPLEEDPFYCKNCNRDKSQFVPVSTFSVNFLQILNLSLLFHSTFNKIVPIYVMAWVYFLI